MRRFEYIRGGSRKFWEVQLVGHNVRVHYGRIGTSGQSDTHNCNSVSEAGAYMQRKIREKLGKGYTEVGVTVEPERPAAVRRPLLVGRPLSRGPSEDLTSEDTDGQEEQDEEDTPAPTPRQRRAAAQAEAQTASTKWGHNKKRIILR